MQRSLALAAMLLCQLSAPQAVGASCDATAAQIEVEIRRTGAKAFIEKHFDQDAWSRVLVGIETAGPRWLAIGESLKPHSDAGSSEELTDAFFSALAVDPLRTLPVLMRVYKSGPEELCNQTFEAQLPKQGVEPYLNAIERGLRNPKTKTQRSMATACRKGLQASRKFARENGLLQ